MAENIDGKVDDSSYNGRVSDVAHDINTGRLRLQLMYHETVLEEAGSVGFSYLLMDTTYENGEIDALLSRFSVPCPDQLLGKLVKVYHQPENKYEIRPLE